MKKFLHRRTVVAILIGTAGIAVASADQIISDDLIVNGGSVCVGSECVDGEFFAFDSVRIRGPEPRLEFLDTSNSGSFPSDDWKIGISDDGTGGASFLFVDHDNSGARVLQMTSDGSVALGAASELVPGAISVGSMGNERPIVHVAAGVDDTDAVNMGQFQTFQDDVFARLGSDADDFDQRLTDIQARIDDLVNRVDALSETE